MAHSSRGPRRPAALSERQVHLYGAERRLEATIVGLRDELRSTQAELAALREATAEMLSAIAVGLHRPQSGPAGDRPTFPAEILDLASLSGAPSPADDRIDGSEPQDPITGEVPAFDAGRDESLARLDRRFRWSKPARRS